MIKRASALALLVLAALSGCGSRDPDDGPPPHEVPSIAPSMPATVNDPGATAELRSFAGRDANHDGFLSSAENAAAADNVFDAIDKDQDGELSVPELNAARAALGLAMVPSSEELIGRADQDNDHQLTLAEWIAQEGRAFKAADTDGDGKLSNAEWRAMPHLETSVTTLAPAATPGAEPSTAPSTAAAKSQAK